MCACRQTRTSLLISDCDIGVGVTIVRVHNEPFYSYISHDKIADDCGNEMFLQYHLSSARMGNTRNFRVPYFNAGSSSRM